MKQKIVLFLLFTCMAMCACGSAEAQFWKKKSVRRHKHKDTGDTTMGGNMDAPDKESKKEFKKREKEGRKKEKEARKRKHKKGEAGKTTAKKPPARLRQDVAWPPTTIKSRYRVEVLSPLYLDELAKGRDGKPMIPGKALPGLAFYEGVQAAADSLKKAGFNIDIYIHDAASAAEPASVLVSAGKLDSADLVIGAVQPPDVPVLAAFALKKQVNFISALSATDGGVKNNPYFTMVEPSLKSHCGWIAGDIARKFPVGNVVIMHRDVVPADEDAYKYLAGSDSIKPSYRQLLCNSLPPKDSLAAMLDANGHNIIVIPILDIAFADSLLHGLSGDFPGMEFEVYGMPSWKGAAFTRSANLPNLRINITYPFYFDRSSATGKYVTHYCKEKFGQPASEHVFRGYEAMYWYASLLKNYGTIFNEKYNDISAAPFTKFDITLRRDGNGNILFYENAHLSMTTYGHGIKKTN